MGVAQVEPLIIRSRSDQFIVIGMPSANSPRALSSLVDAKPLGQGHVFWLQPNASGSAQNAKIFLEPGLVAVTCERIKTALLRELKLNDSSDHARIYIQLNKRLKQQNTRVVADQYERGWMYAVEFPVEVDEHFYTATVLQVLLYELANRHSPQQQIDLPSWLISGFISYLQSTSLQTLALQPNLQMFRVQDKVDPLSEVRKKFEQELPLSFEELSWPGALPKDRAALYRDSAHFFVQQLMQLPGGHESMKRFIMELQRHHNWQFAFLAAFKKNFGELVDVEKWWSVNFVSFMGRDASQLWSEEESWRQLKASLDVTMNVHLDADRMPVTAEYNLQEAISKWDYARQDLAISKALNQLRILRFRAHPELRPLVDGYRKVLDKYVEQRLKLGRNAGKNEQALTPNMLKKTACKQLDALDDERARLRKVFLSTENASAK